MSRNPGRAEATAVGLVTSREGRVSRNDEIYRRLKRFFVTSREGRVSRNDARETAFTAATTSRPARDV